MTNLCSELNVETVHLLGKGECAYIDKKVADLVLNSKRIYQTWNRYLLQGTDVLQHHRSLSQRQIEASSQTAIKIPLSRLKLVCLMADVHLGRVRVVHFALCGSSTSRSQT